MTARVLYTVPKQSDLGWQNQSVCRDEDPELFHPVSDTAVGVRGQIADAKAVCAPCPVRKTCLLYALDTGTDHGIYGGLTGTERRALKAVTNWRQRVLSAL